jgi:hypothetical protein
MIGIMTMMMPVTLEAPAARDVRTRRVADYTARHRAHRTSDDRSRNGAHGAIAQSLLRSGNGRRECNTGGNGGSCENFLHGVPPFNNDVISKIAD